MKDVSELFWKASTDEIQKGYVYVDKEDSFVCLVCGRAFTKGIIYQEAGIFYEAEKFASLHIIAEHESMFHYLLNMNKKLTGLTDLQKQLIGLFHSGLSDKEIVKELGGGSTSTIRNHRFTMREREKQAKVYLALMGLLDKKVENGRDTSFIPVPKTATVLDERFAITEQENEEFMRTYFPDGVDGRLTKFPKKEKRKVAILRQLITRFEAGKQYSEKEVNEILKEAWDDYVTLRRYLIEYGFMKRLDDCSAYWVHS
ncbi:DUF2087 domain-containing protein [Paenibacillus sp. FJAT-26967]|uniref:DUF2087 domain-containing protein n=1 Tax=Paenibacillus sp. FJAT-26967 TaxID=1729690 RepID=UPI0008384731|nr:DUF2087 domain-containing protein [Paenibacillus sp. FJAT-26967]